MTRSNVPYIGVVTEDGETAAIFPQHINAVTASENGGTAVTCVGQSGPVLLKTKVADFLRQISDWFGTQTIGTEVSVALGEAKLALDMVLDTVASKPDLATIFEEPPGLTDQCTKAREKLAKALEAGRNIRLEGGALKAMSEVLDTEKPVGAPGCPAIIDYDDQSDIWRVLFHTKDIPITVMVEPDLAGSLTFSMDGRDSLDITMVDE